MDYDFSRFEARSFEKFAQALVIDRLGEGIRVYGDGPDGGREASFEGKLDFPTAENGWDGYTIVQAKFRQNSGGALEDANWLVKEMQAELNKFLDPKKELRLPEYYLLITNARLSPAPKTSRGAGGIEKVTEVFEDFARRSGIRDFAIWHYDEIAARISPELRQNYAAWITPSDVLSEAISSAKLSGPSFHKTMNLFLARELKNQRTTRFQQAGHGGDSNINLEDVFVDLPYEQETSRTPHSAPHMLLESLMHKSAKTFRPPPRGAGKSVETTRNRFLLLGGPGQGKSTISQYFAQILRASLVQSELTLPVSSEVEAAASEILNKAAKSNLPTNIPRRFPLRVDLPSFADALAVEQSSGVSLIEFIRRQISRVADRDLLSLDDVRHWMEVYPFVILLDGLDEVPPAANRSEVISAINDFWDEVAAASGDIMMVVTTRPQGYNDDLDPGLYQKYQMTKLSPTDAQNYAVKIANSRLPDPEQRELVLSRLKEALANSTTAHLLISPLQVAIMIALIDQRGEAPTDRWTLFEKYFNVVLEREQQKPGSAGQTVKRWGRLITALHQSVGFALHVQAEEKGSSEAHLTKDELKRLVSDQLRRDGYKGDELEASVAELIEITTDRLILLVQRVDQKFSFEVRSLQEFMAAAFLMSGRETVVRNRLREISNKSHWRHVFQIAASKCFSTIDTQHYRDAIVGICRELDAVSDATDIELKNGGRLALSLLEDGLAYDQPSMRHLLLLEALEIVRSGAYELLPALAEVSKRDKSVVEKFLDENIDASCAQVRSACWRLLLLVSDEGEDWADKLGEKHWPASLERQLSIISEGFVPNDKLLEKFDEVFRENGPAACRGLDLGDPRGLTDMFQAFPFLELFQGTGTNLVTESSLDIEMLSSPIAMTSMSIDPDREIIDRLYSVPSGPSWEIFRKVAEFFESPSTDSLADLTMALSGEENLEALRGCSAVLPWPLLILIHSGEFVAFERLAEQVEAGGFGNPSAWREAESRWQSRGVDASDISYLETGNLVSRDGDVGMAWPSSISVTHQDIPSWEAPILTSLQASQGLPRCLLAWFCNFGLAVLSPSRLLTAPEAVSIVRDTFAQRRRYLHTEFLFSVSEGGLRSAEFAERVAEVGMSGRLISRGGRRVDNLAQLQPLIEQAPEHPGLLSVIGEVCRNGDVDNVSLDAAIEAARINRNYGEHRLRSVANAFLLAYSTEDEGDIDLVLTDPTPQVALDILISTLRGRRFDLHISVDLYLRSLQHLKFKNPTQARPFSRDLLRLGDERVSAVASSTSYESLDFSREMFLVHND